MMASRTNQPLARWSVNYRGGQNRLGTRRNRATLWLTALRWRSLSRKVLLVNRVVSIGHSSGGHLALWLAGRAKLPQTSELYMKNPLQLKGVVDRSEEHTSELQSRRDLVCRLLLEKKKKKTRQDEKS